MTGLQTALHEITLVLFTTLAPASIFSCILIALLLFFSEFEAKEYIRVQHMAVLPLSLAMVGLVASATHLGTPSNALYVLTGIGRSPLSNEVATAIVFLGLNGLCWLYSFTLKPRIGIQKIWNILNAISGIFCINMIAFAYSEPTILTWNTWHVPANIWLSALAGGPLITFLTLRYAHVPLKNLSCSTTLPVGGSIAGALGALVLVLQIHDLKFIRNGIGTADELVGLYPLMVGIYLLCLIVAYVLTLRAIHQTKHVDAPHSAEVSLLALVAATLIFFAGLFIIRFGFYMMHMTAGISL